MTSFKSAVAQKRKGQLTSKELEILFGAYLSFCRNGDLPALVGEQYSPTSGEKWSSSSLISLQTENVLFPQALL